MFASYLIVTSFILHADAPSTRFEQVAPVPKMQKIVRSAGQARAIILVHGLTLHLFKSEKISQPLMRDWQQKDSRMVQSLAKSGDVFSFAYAQTAALDVIASRAELLKQIIAIKKLGYREIVLIGHSAGGVIARHLVEDHPRSGVTKVIQICSPNGGSTWARYAIVRTAQKAFVRSLTKEARMKVLSQRKTKQIPKGVELICLVGNGAGKGDGLVDCDCQWTTHLREQGIPAFALPTTHWRAMRSAKSIQQIAEHVTKSHPRWSSKEVHAAEKLLIDGEE